MAASYTVRHDGGETLVTVDQTRNGGEWSLFGLFDMTPGLGHGVTLAGDAEALTVETDIVIDNLSPLVSTVGTWGQSTNIGGYWDTNYAQHAAGSGTNQFIWPAAVPESGRYKVYARWTQKANRATNAKYTVHHAAGSDIITVNQELNGGLWVLLGAFDLDPVEDVHGVVLSDKANDKVIADAVRFVRDAASVPAEEIVIDNTDPQVSVQGAWASSVWALGGLFWGADFLRTDQVVAGQTVTWTPDLAAAGHYKIYARWTSSAGRASDAPYTVHHAGGQTTLRMNQEVNGGIWVPLGGFDLAPGANHRVVLSNDANEKVIADAIKLVRTASAASAGETVVDNADPEVSIQGAWVSSTWAEGGSFWGADFLKIDPGATVDTVTWTPGLAEAGRYRIYARWTAGPNRATDAPYTVHHAGGATTLRVNQELNGGEWVLLGGFELAPGQSHRVVLSNDADERVVADAVRFVFDGASRAVVADAVKLERAPGPNFREYITLNGRPFALIEGGSLYYVHIDHLGTPQKMTDGTGAVVWDAVYRPFGEAESITGSASNDQRFPGQLYDAETGFHYNYFRDYAPELGRYMESDPIGLRGGLNTYAYVGGNPISVIDPLGLFSDVPPGYAACASRYPRRVSRRRGTDEYAGIPYPAGRDGCGNCNECDRPVYWMSDGPGHGSPTNYYIIIVWNQSRDEDCCCVPTRDESPTPPADGMFIP